MKNILLTGISGFLGLHTAVVLVKKGYKVTGTLRNLERTKEVLDAITCSGANADAVTIAQADLLSTEVWESLCVGVDAVIHTASPFPSTLPRNEQELIAPAVEGTMNILRAAHKAGVQHVVVTSSTGAILYGRAKNEKKIVCDESVWTNLNNPQDLTAYFKSKTLAEQAAWDFVRSHAGMYLTTICPGAMVGELLTPDYSSSVNIVLKTLKGDAPAIPRLGFEMCDVRSVAELHVLAIERNEARNERFIATAGYWWFEEVAQTLRQAYPERKKIPKALLPDFMVRVASNFDPTLKPLLLELGRQRQTTSQKARQKLGWQPTPIKEAVLRCAESAIAHKLA